MKRSLALVLIFTILIACRAIADQGNPRRYIAAPQSHLFGKSFDTWMSLYWHWYWPDFYGAPGPDNQVGKVSFLPVPIGGGEISTTVRKGQFLVVPLAVLTGESYVEELGVPDDNPADFFPDQYLDFRLEIDGETVLDSEQDDPTQYLFDVAAFDPPFTYPEPEFRYHDDDLGDIYADAAVWSQGTGCILFPLPVGEHTIVIDFSFPIFGDDGGFTNTIHVSVSE